MAFELVYVGEACPRVGPSYHTVYLMRTADRMTDRATNYGSRAYFCGSTGSSVFLQDINAFQSSIEMNDITEHQFIVISRAHILKKRACNSMVTT